MNCKWYAAILLALVVISAVAGMVNTAQAAIPLVYTNENFWVSEHDRPTSFWQDAQGNFFGTTATGKSFEQRNIENSLSIKLQRFAIDEAFYYISDKGIITASTNTKALSIYLARAS